MRGSTALCIREHWIMKACAMRDPLRLDKFGFSLNPRIHKIAYATQNGDVLICVCSARRSTSALFLHLCQ